MYWSFKNATAHKLVRVIFAMLQKRICFMEVVVLIPYGVKAVAPIR
jgi:hypothetical protein